MFDVLAELLERAGKVLLCLAILLLLWFVFFVYLPAFFAPSSG